MERPTIRHHLAERELRSLNTDEFLALLREDIRELDALIAARRPAPKGQEKKGRQHRSAKEAIDEVMGADDEPEAVKMHSVTCCNHHMGDFPPWARVRCPFCNEWHRVGDFPVV
ncbi:MAG: hypothetical protein K0R39_1574 [Symbiobacteriaceae bacterium]|jgi:hypothetical protein|nr:hypothetical protein [Symbiobacteriaceae bacterium]